MVQGLNIEDSSSIYKDIINNKNNTFCILPFMSVTCHQNGALRLCCEDEWVKEESVLGNISSMSIKEFHNSEKIQEIRKKMLEGKSVKYCTWCYSKDKKWIRSKRYYNNQKYRKLIEWSIKKTEIQTWFTQQSISYLDIRFSNICNLSCKMCSSFSSTARRKLEKELWFDQQYIHDKYSGFWKPEVFIDVIDTVEEVYAVGWEPFLDNEFKALIPFLCEIWRAKDIYLRINTNLTVIDSQVFSMLQEFKKVQFLVSCDGYNSGYNKIRLWGKWEYFKKNLLYLMKLQRQIWNIHIRINVVVQLDNIFNITKLHMFFHELGIYDVNFIMLDHPAHMNISILPSQTKKDVLKRIYLFIQKYESQTDIQFDTMYKDIITTLRNPWYDKDLLEKYTKQNTIFNKYIKQ